MCSMIGTHLFVRKCKHILVLIYPCDDDNDMYSAFYSPMEATSNENTSQLSLTDYDRLKAGPNGRVLNKFHVF